MMEVWHRRNWSLCRWTAWSGGKLFDLIRTTRGVSVGGRSYGTTTFQRETSLLVPPVPALNTPQPQTLFVLFFFIILVVLVASHSHTQQVISCCRTSLNTTTCRVFDFHHHVTLEVQEVVRECSSF